MSRNKEFYTRFYKSTPRRRLSDRQKEEIFCAIERGASYIRRVLGELDNKVIVADGTVHAFPGKAYTDALFRWGRVCKGFTQPRFLYRYERKRAIRRRAAGVAAEMNINSLEVERFFLHWMRDFYYD